MMPAAGSVATSKKQSLKNTKVSVSLIFADISKSEEISRWRPIDKDLHYDFSATEMGSNGKLMGVVKTSRVSSLNSCLVRETSCRGLFCVSTLSSVIAHLLYLFIYLYVLVFLKTPSCIYLYVF